MDSRTRNHRTDTRTSRKAHSFDSCHTRAHTDRRRHTDHKSLRSNYRSPTRRKPTASNRDSSRWSARRRSLAATAPIRAARRSQPLVSLLVAWLLDSGGTASDPNRSTPLLLASLVARPGWTPHRTRAPVQVPEPAGRRAAEPAPGFGKPPPIEAY